MVNKFLYTKPNLSQFSRMDLINLLRDYCNLRIQAKLGQLKKLHLLKKKRREIAMIQYYLPYKKFIKK